MCSISRSQHPSYRGALVLVGVTGLNHPLPTKDVVRQRLLETVLGSVWNGMRAATGILGSISLNKVKEGKEVAVDYACKVCINISYVIWQVYIQSQTCYAELLLFYITGH
jgi:hypothetical protein